MIQRIQTLYLLIATLLSGGLIFVFNLWKNSDESLYFAIDGFKSGSTMLMVGSALFFISALMTLVTIFYYKRRQLQFVLGRLVIAINFFLLGILVYFAQNLSGEVQISEKGIGLLIPVITIVLVALANKAIKKDEELVKSVDRLR